MTPTLPSKTSRIVLWLWIATLGIALGAGLYESRIVIPDWLYRRPDGNWFWDAAAARHSDTGLRFWAFVSLVRGATVVVTDSGGLQEETTYDGRKLKWSDEARKGLWTMKNAYQRRRVKARVEKRARMMKLDAITLEFARQVIEDETGTPLEIGVKAVPTEAALAAAGEAKLIARDDKKNPLISALDWTDDATKRIMRVPAGFMRNKTQERIEELARERAAPMRHATVGVEQTQGILVRRLNEEPEDLAVSLQDAFDREAFHDFVLAQGLLPPVLMRKAVMEEFVSTQTAAADAATPAGGRAGN